MKKIAFAFDVLIIGLLFGNNFSSNKFLSPGFWNTFTIALLLTLSIVLLLTAILKKRKWLKEG